MWLLEQLHLFIMRHHSAPFGLIWTTITAIAAMGTTLVMREEEAQRGRRERHPRSIAFRGDTLGTLSFGTKVGPAGSRVGRRGQPLGPNLFVRIFQLRQS